MNNRPPDRVSAFRVIGRLVLGLVPLALLIVLSETALWALGLGGAPTLATTSRGFDEAAQYLVPDTSTPGAWRTQVYDDPTQEVVFAPKGDATRVLLVGGSNTKLFPETVLQDLLNQHALETDSGRTWEVLNIGRPGYGSERVRIYLKQAMVLHPDVVVIYSGHNEFVESTFALEIGVDAEEPWMKRVASRFRVLRGFNLLADVFAHQGAGSSAWADGDTRTHDSTTTAPEPWAPAVPASFDLAPEQTQRHYEAYERNLVAMCDIARRGGARVLVCTPLSNMLVPPTQLTPDRWVEHTGLTPEQLKELGLTLRRAKLLVPERFRALLGAPNHLRVFTWYGAYQEGIQDQPYEAPVLRPLGPPLDVAPADDNGRLSGSVEGAHWPDPSGWGSITRQVVSDMKLLMDRKITQAERAQLEKSAEAYREVIEMSHRMPEQQFAYATVLWLLGRDEEAARWFQSARDDDPAPRAASSQIHDAIRRTAAARDDVALLDSSLLFTEADPNRLPGYEMMMDSCHMQPGVRVALMHELADVLPGLMDLDR